MKKIIKRFKWGPILFGIVAIEASDPFSLSFEAYTRGVLLSSTARWVMIFAGVLCIVYGLFYKSFMSSKKIVDCEKTICPKCERPFEVGKISKDGLCPNCQVSVEPLEGFYDRHSELKEAGEEIPEKSEDIK
ncbi:hypothetical protein [Maridesulfovibrio frigidus]|uniref:hypothetical protein n=1 Tax=Maridesulfovibrio frigidus TaxID=340956 RepID=UPI0004E146FE|nr:hypothetical protein [Maridesulfovibrio frigidus]